MSLSNIHFFSAIPTPKKKFFFLFFQVSFSCNIRLFVYGSLFVRRVHLLHAAKERTLLSKKIYICMSANVKGSFKISFFFLLLFFFSFFVVSSFIFVYYNKMIFFFVWECLFFCECLKVFFFFLGTIARTFVTHKFCIGFIGQFE